MRYLITLLIAALSLNAFGQMPYNPDSNDDNEIGLPDLLTFLGVYGTTLVDSSLTCDYEGTELEEYLGGIFSQTLILDSVYVEYLYIESVITYLPGCPDPVEIETILDRSYMLSSFEIYTGSSYQSINGGSSFLGYYRSVEFNFFPGSGNYHCNVRDDEIGALTNYTASEYIFCCQGMPFPPSWTLNENGIQNVILDSNSWVANCENFRLIPFWHEAE